MIDALKEMIGSKKALAAITGVIVALAARYGLELETEAVAAIVSPIVAYILSQGYVDRGKASP